MAKTRIWCKRHRRWHSKHADYHCKHGDCTPERLNRLVTMQSKDGKKYEVRAPHCPLWRDSD